MGKFGENGLSFSVASNDNSEIKVASAEPELSSLGPVAQELSQLQQTPLAPDTAPEEKAFGDSVAELRTALIPEILVRHPGLTRQKLEKMMEEMGF